MEQPAPSRQVNAVERGHDRIASLEIQLNVGEGMCLLSFG
jgi:hypothetical protein